MGNQKSSPGNLQLRGLAMWAEQTVQSSQHQVNWSSSYHLHQFEGGLMAVMADHLGRAPSKKNRPSRSA